MKGDFTRSTFHPEKHYRGVLSQQGRVQLDADSNEQLAIQRHLDETTNSDVIGGCGVPKQGGGFLIGASPGGDDLTISAGRIYVDGILCELEGSAVELLEVELGSAKAAQASIDGKTLTPGSLVEIFDGAAPTTTQVVRLSKVEDRDFEFEPDLTILTQLQNPSARPMVRQVASYLTQPDLPSPESTIALEGGTLKLELEDGSYLAYLDVWLRHITALDDPRILETALGGPDTANRMKVIAQVKLEKVDAGVKCRELPSPADLLAKSEHRLPTTGRLAARAHPPEDPTDTCIIPPDARYQGLENQLYRVEVHEAGELGDATFKWSRENGSVVVAWEGQQGTGSNRLTVGSTGRDAVLGFASGQLVELCDDTRELGGIPGVLVELHEPPQENTLVIDPGASVDFANFPIIPKVRRWDCPALQNVRRPNTNDGYLRLENGVEVRFEDGYYNTGDYWLIPARTATRQVEWLESPSGDALPLSPAGIVHHYCKLAVFTITGGVVDPGIEDCRDLFPSLTAICAEDVCYDNEHCQIPGAQNVQDALDALCEGSNLRRHKKYLHGWGIVCGLDLTCRFVDGQARGVTLNGGYAIDCEGNDLILDDPRAIDIFKLISETDQDLIKNGNGDVCLTMRGDLEEGIVIEAEAHDPRPDTLAEHLDGTLLMDIYNDCIKRVEDFIRKELETREGEVAGPAAQKKSILASLLAQVFGPSKQIYVSKREHDIMLDFYTRLRELLQSETFCAMFAGAHPFPEYPGSMPPKMDTIFGMGHHERIRLRPNSKEAYTVGGGINPVSPVSMINRYDLERKVLVERIDPMVGKAAAGKSSTGIGAVDDVAYSFDGKRIFMVAPTRNNKNTLFRAGTITDQGVNWGSLVTICGVRIVTLATTPADRTNVYGAGLGKGIYRINPDNVDPSMAPAVAFNAAGHLSLATDGKGYATAAKSSTMAPGSYDQVAAFNVGGSSPQGFVELGSSGQDDMAIFDGLQGNDEIYVVLGQSARRLGRYSPTTQLSVVDLDTSSAVKLAVDQSNGPVLALLEDDFSMRMITRSDEVVSSYHVPVQVAPTSLAVGPSHAVALNYGSDTLTFIHRDNLKASFQFPHADLQKYREGIVLAFRDLLAGFLQYLRDCICHHLLVRCPDCSGDEKIYLGCVSIRDDRVYRVCNFSRRKYVKSFPTVGYWMSLVPILPALDMLLEKFCCAVLPDLFRKFEYDSTASRPNVKASSARSGVKKLQLLDIGSQFLDFKHKLPIAGGVVVKGAATNLGSAQRTKPVPVDAVVGVPAEEAAAKLTNDGLQVTTQPVAELSLTGIISSLPGFFRKPAPGEEVVLHTDNQGVVLFASSAKLRNKANLGGVRSLGEPAPGDQIGELREQLNGMQAELEELRRFREEVNRRMPPEVG